MTDQDPGSLSRRSLLVAGGATGLLAVTAGCAATGRGPAGSGSVTPNAGKPGPYEDMRELVAALDARGRVMWVDRIDQDAFEATALLYRLVDRYGLEGAPLVVFREVRIDGRWVQGPVIANYLGPWDTECLVFGLEPDPSDGTRSFRRARSHLVELARANGGRYPEIPPVVVDAAEAPCKEVILRGDEIDLTRFPFLKVNPADGGRYINTASVYTTDPRAGVNIGTYRCQLKGPRKVAVSPGEGQTGWRMLDAARKRGEKTVPVTLILGQDPIVYTVSGTRTANRVGDRPVDELAVAGGLRGRALRVVRSETNDFLVPATCEMVIEGEIPLDDMEPEGPYGEALGFQGRGERAWYMHVTAVTHRRNPWFHNSFTGVDRGPIKSPGVASLYLFAKRFVPEVADVHYFSNANNVQLISIEKTRPGQGLEVGEKLGKFNPVAKVVIVFDRDVDLMNMSQVISALSSRWQPSPASRIFTDLPGLPMDPSLPARNRTSKIIIDATRQLPDEGGPAAFPRSNRELLQQGAPDAFARVDQRWEEFLQGWTARG